MAEISVELYDKLQQRVDRVRDIGLSMGLSDRDVDQCVYEALGIERPKVKSANLNRLLQRAIKATYYTSIALLLVCTFVNFHQPTSQTISEYTRPWHRPLLRQARLLIFPFIKKLHLDDLYESSCVLSNPLFKEPKVDCWPCEDVKEILELSNLEHISDYKMHANLPLVIKGAQKPVSFEEIATLYNSHRRDFLDSSDSISSSDESISLLEEVFNKFQTTKDFESAGIGVSWRTFRVLGSRHIRELFVRPNCVSKKSEISLEKFLFIDTPAAGGFQLPITYLPTAFVVQGSGSREVVLFPRESCQSACPQLSVILDPGDLLFYQTNLWRPESFPTGDDVTITFLGSFY